MLQDEGVFSVILERIVGDILFDRHVLYRGNDSQRVIESRLIGQFICVLLMAGFSPRTCLSEALQFVDSKSNLMSIKPVAMRLHDAELYPEIVWTHCSDLSCLFVVSPNSETEIYY